MAGILASLVFVGGAPHGARSLDLEAERLAQLLALAREEAQVRGAPIRFEHDAQGFRFSVYRDRQWRPLLDDPDLRPREWDRVRELSLRRADGLAALVFGRDAVEPPYEIALVGDSGDSALIRANGLGAFSVGR